MKNENVLIPFEPSRLGQQISPGHGNYSNDLLAQKRTQLETLGLEWALLEASATRSIPEFFISGLSQAGMSPIVSFSFDLEHPPLVEEIAGQLKAYANWGVGYISFFDRPNLRSSWPSVGWTQRGLVTRFLEIFVPLAKATIQAGITPLFPALDPGGDYWDTAFLRRALEEMQENGEDDLLGKLALGAHVDLNSHSFEWGAGGPERWPASIPYDTPEGSEDQRGFRIFDWYNAISRVVAENEMPIILFAKGEGKDLLQMAKLTSISAEAGFGKDLEVPDNVIAIIFTSDDGQGDFCFDENGTVTGVGQKWIAWKSGRNEVEQAPIASDKQAKIDSKEIQHYMLLPTYRWGKSLFHQEVIRSFVKKHNPAVGYSLSSARKAEKVTLVGGSQIFTEDIIKLLSSSGCDVKHITGDGNQIAQQLAIL